MSNHQFINLTMDENTSTIGRLEIDEQNEVPTKVLGTSLSTTPPIVKRKHMLQNTPLEAKRRLIAQHKELDDTVLLWLKQKQSLNLPISRRILQTKVNQVAEQIMIKDFKCSKYWIRNFQHEHNITLDKVSDKSSAVDTNVFYNWLTDIWPSLRAKYSDNNIYNADEAGIFFRLTPDQTPCFKDQNCLDGELPKERITVLVAANMTGTDKRKLLVIGKSKCPPCFKGVTSLPILYENNKKSWMTSEIFEKTLNSWNDELRRKREKILLLVDNCPAHQIKQLEFIKLVLLPLDTHAVLQPMNRGIIRNLKTHYRNQLILKIIKDMETQVESQINMLDAIVMLEKAWHDINPMAINYCFQLAGFCKKRTNITEEQLDNNSKFDGIVEDFVKIDDNLGTSDDMDLTLFIDDLTSYESENNNDSDEFDDDFGIVPSKIDTRAAFRTLEHFYFTTFDLTNDERRAIVLLEKLVP